MPPPRDRRPRALDREPVQLQARILVGATTHQPRRGASASACAALAAQILVLEGWIGAAAHGAVPFIVLGDFSRRVTHPHDRVWADLDDGEPANADLTAPTQDMPISGRDHTFTECIDHLVVDPRVPPSVDRTSASRVTYRQVDKAVWGQLSEHCPVFVKAWVR